MARLLYLSLLLFAVEVRAATITAASVTYGAVQAAIDSASDGDVVVVPAGGTNWTTIVTIDNKAITLLGSGSTQTLITNGVSGAPMLDCINFATKRYTITGFNFVDVPTGYAGGQVRVTGTQWRICTNRFYVRAASIMHLGLPGGLIDHNFFDASGGGGMGLNPSGVNSIGVTSLWSTAIAYGVEANWIYIENNEFSWPDGSSGANGANDAYNATAQVFRYNQVTNTWFGTHGCDSGGYRSTFGVEVYSNLFVKTGVASLALGLESRGGTGLYWGNTFVGAYNYALVMRTYRFPESGMGSSICASELGGCSPWGEMDGTKVCDGNSDGTGYPGLDQTGRTGPTTFGGSSSTQTLSPVYYFSNNVSAATLSLGEVVANSCAVYNRDWKTNALAGYAPLGAHSLSVSQDINPGDYIPGYRPINFRMR